MKRTLLLVIWSILTISIYAQVPQGISHQATIRNSSNELITSSPIGLRVSILPGSVEGISVYVETHHPTSNSNGLITYVIGSGTVVSGVFSDIDWTSGIYFLKTEVDPLGGTDYVISGATQFRTVPFAFHAETAESFTETDPVYSADPAAFITDAGSGAVITDAERTKLGGIEDGAEVNVQSDWTEADNTNDAYIANKPTLFTTSDETDPVYSADPAFSITDAGSGAVITDAERTKLGGIADGAEVNVQSNWSEADNTNDAYIANKPTLFSNSDETDPVYSLDPAASITDAGSGAVITDAERTKLGGIADGAEVNVQSNWTEADNTSDAYIANKPTLFTTSDETDPVVGAIDGIIKADGAGNISAALEGTDYSLLPDQTGNSGKYLSTDGSSTSWQATGGGGSSFAHFFALMPPDNAATVAPGTDVLFPQDGPTSGTDITRTGPSSFNLASIGTYAVNWQVSVDEAGQLILTLNGVDLAYTVVGRATGTSQLSGTALITTYVINSILTVRNPAGNPTALTITPLAGGTRPVSASLVITQVQ